MRIKIAVAALAATLLAATAATPWAQGRGAAGEPAPRTITYDFPSGVKTTTYDDGSVLEEAFDERKARRLAPRPGDKGVVGNRE